MSSIDKLLEIISEAPERQIDKCITERVKKLIGGNDELVSIELKTILDDCVAGALATDFAMNILYQARISAINADRKG